MIDVHYASLTFQGVQHRVFHQDGYPSRYQPRPTEFNFAEQTGTAVFPLVIAVPHIAVPYRKGNSEISYWSRSITKEAYRGVS